MRTGVRKYDDDDDGKAFLNEPLFNKSDKTAARLRIAMAVRAAAF